MPRIAILTDESRAFCAGADPRNQLLVRRRHRFWAQLAAFQGWDLAVVDARLLDAGVDLAGALAWIDLPMLPHEQYCRVAARAQAAGAIAVLDAPEAVERVLRLDRFHPV